MRKYKVYFWTKSLDARREDNRIDEVILVGRMALDKFRAYHVVSRIVEL